jgi:PadR family transcriptional regulator, regulatory protein PadR
MITERCLCSETFSRLHRHPHLHHAAHAPVFGLTLNRELARHGVDMSIGTVYPILHELESAGYLRREDRVIGGKVRKYHRITPWGTQALAEARMKIAESVVEVLKGKGPSSLADETDPRR